MFDFKERNYEKYGQETPPVYDLKRIGVPVALVVGQTDGITSR